MSYIGGAQSVVLMRDEHTSKLRVRISDKTPSWRKEGLGSADVLIELHRRDDMVELEVTEHPPIDTGHSRTTMVCLQPAAARALYEELRVLFDLTMGPVKTSYPYCLDYYPAGVLHGMSSINFQAEDYDQARQHAEQLCAKNGWRLASVVQVHC